MDVLVTGHRGTVGAAVTDLLQQHGDTVIGYDLRDGQDVLETAALMKAARRAEAVVHLAGPDRHHPPAHPSTVLTETAKAWQIFRANVLGTANVLEAARNAGHTRVVVMSSADVLGDFAGRSAPDRRPIDEHHPCRPDTPYAISKLLAEELCSAFTTATGTPTVCLRPPGLLTSGTHRMTHQALTEQPEFESSLVRRYGALLDVRDLADAVHRALHAPLSGCHRLLLCADVPSASPNSRELVSNLFPGADRRGVAQEEQPCRALLDSARARSVLGWSPHHSWSSTSSTPRPKPPT
ncbi:SDR family oxidoreductase (plasmid) [Kitasatospora sp. NBC_00070]|uniref:NAD-dependent epimerase/dehydratase family protein n=1 Tax=Kitasatospora sp. NBC_00070 TaxID=2975962 RepID=UPI002F91A0BF